MPEEQTQRVLQDLNFRPADMHRKWANSRRMEDAVELGKLLLVAPDLLLLDEPQPPRHPVIEWLEGFLKHYPRP